MIVVLNYNTSSQYIRYIISQMYLKIISFLYYCLELKEIVFIHIFIKSVFIVIYNKHPIINLNLSVIQTSILYLIKNCILIF